MESNPVKSVDAKSFSVQLPLSGAGENWHQLCLCRTSEALAEVVRSLTANGVIGPLSLRIEVLYGN